MSIESAFNLQRWLRPLFVLLGLAVVPAIGWCDYTYFGSLEIPCVAPGTNRHDGAGNGAIAPAPFTLAGTCDYGPAQSVNFSASAAVELDPARSLISLSAQSSEAAGATIAARVGFVATVSGANGAPVTLGIVDSYTMTQTFAPVSLLRPPSKTETMLEIEVAGGQAGPPVQVWLTNQPGTATGVLQTKDFEVACCTLNFEMTAVVGAFSGSASLVDPLQVVLTPDEIAAGWTVTVTEGPLLTPVPEPATAGPLGLGLAMLTMLRRRRKLR